MKPEDVKVGMYFTRVPKDDKVKPYAVQVRELNAINALVAHYGGSEWIPMADLASGGDTPTGKYTPVAAKSEDTAPTKV